MKKYILVFLGICGFCANTGLAQNISCTLSLDAKQTDDDAVIVFDFKNDSASNVYILELEDTPQVVVQVWVDGEGIEITPSLWWNLRAFPGAGPLGWFEIESGKTRRVCYALSKFVRLQGEHPGSAKWKSDLANMRCRIIGKFELWHSDAKAKEKPITLFSNELRLRMPDSWHNYHDEPDSK